MAPTFEHELITVLPQLRAFARSLKSGNPDAGDDLVQDAVARALAARDQYTLGTNFKAWIFTIARNLHINKLRQRKFQAAPLDDAPQETWSVMPRQDDKLEVDDLQRAMAKLSPEQREVLILVGASGLSYEDAAEICECAVGTIKSRLSRARRDLFKLLSDNGLDRRAATRRPDRKPTTRKEADYQKVAPATATSRA